MFPIFFLALKIIRKNIIIDNDKVTLILPVILGPIGNIPIKLLINIKKNSVKKKVKYNLYFFIPKLGIAISFFI